MPRFLPIFFLVFTSMLPAQEVKGPELTKYEVLSDALAHNTVPGLVIVDVRPPEEFASGHIPGAVNMPLERAFYEFPSKSASAPILVYGRAASADARKAVDILRTRGYRNVILFGSITQWKGELQ